MRQEFDQWLEKELDRGFAALSSWPVPSEPRYRTGIATTRRNPLSIAIAALSGSKVLVPVLAAALITGGGTAAAAVATGTNPMAFGQEVSAAVVSCRDQLASGQHGIGQCVSEFVLAHRPDPPNGLGATDTDKGKAKRSGASDMDGPKATDKGSARSTAAGHGEGAQGMGSSHGSAVSEAARSASPSEGHGEAVSAVARSNAQGAETADPSATGGGHANGAAFGQGQATEARSNGTSGQAHGEAASAADRGSDRAVRRPAATPSPTPSDLEVPGRPGNSRAAPRSGRVPPNQ